MAVSDYSTTAASNTAISGIDISGATGKVKDGDNAIRQIMADIKAGVPYLTSTTLGLPSGTTAVAYSGATVSYSTTAAGTLLTLESTEAGATAGPVLQLYRNSATPTASDIIGQVLFNGEDSAGNTQEYASIQTVITDATSGSEDSTLDFYTVVAGTRTRALSISNYGVIALGSPTATTSGTSIDYTSIPAGVKRITINLAGVSTSGTSLVMVQLGDSDGIENSGYLGTALSAEAAGNTATNFSAGFGIVAGLLAASVLHGTVTLTLVDASTNTWAFASNIGLSNGAFAAFAGGSKSLSATLDRVRLTTVGGSDTFDAGKINITYE